MPKPVPFTIRDLHAHLDLLLQQKSQAHSWGKVAVEITLQDGKPVAAKLQDETTLKFSQSSDAS